MTSIATRLRALIESKHLSVKEFARVIGVSDVAVYGWLNNKSDPTGERLERIADFFQVTPAYLRYGEVGTDAPQTIELDNDTISIPVLDVRGACGGGGALSPTVSLVKMLRVAREWLTSRLPSWASVSYLHIITADGDSMLPKIDHGDFVIVDSSITTITADAVYAIQYSGSVFIKRIQSHPDGTVMLISDNEAYKPIVVSDPSTLKIVGRCVLSFNVRRI